MKKAVKSKRRTELLKKIMKNLKKHNLLSDQVSRQRDKEGPLQKALFLTLQDNLVTYLEEYGLNEKKSKEIKKNFKFEQKVSTTVNNFTVFSTNHRPDAVLGIEDIRVVIELKKGKDGAALRSGIGQSLIYSSEYEFVIYLFIDTTPNQNIRKSINAIREKEIIADLWENHNVMFDIV